MELTNVINSAKASSILSGCEVICDFDRYVLMDILDENLYVFSKEKITDEGYSFGFETDFNSAYYFIQNNPDFGKYMNDKFKQLKFVSLSPDLVQYVFSKTFDSKGKRKKHRGFFDKKPYVTPDQVAALKKLASDKNYNLLECPAQNSASFNWTGGGR